MIDNIRHLKESTSNLRYVSENIEDLHTNIHILLLICIFQTIHNIIGIRKTVLKTYRSGTGKETNYIVEGIR